MTLEAWLAGATALAELAGCLLAYRVLRRRSPSWVLVPAALALSLGVWLLNSECWSR